MMQHETNNRCIILTQRPLVWSMEFDYEQIYNRVSVDTDYSAHKNADPSGETNIMLDDDKPLFRYYLALAISDLTSLLARRIDPSIVIKDEDGNIIENSGMVESTTSIKYYLVMDENLEKHLLSSLYRYCFEYLSVRVLEMWHKQPQGSDGFKSDIIRVLDFRRKPVRRPIRNLL